MTANDSSSSATDPPRPAELELDLAGRLPPLPAAFLDGRDLDLLSPLRFAGPGEMPVGDPPRIDRSELAAALHTANAAYGHPEAANLAERLADPATRVVVTGQQPGLYGGPLLTLTKMAAAVRWAEELTAAGKPTVAVFWVATEDHDWAEAAQATLATKSGPRKFDLGDDPAPLMPLGMRTMGSALTAATAEMLDALGGEDAAPSVVDAGRWYRPDARIGEAFCRFMVSLLGARAPLMLDSMLSEMKRLQRPWLLRLVDRRREVEEALARADRELEARGYPLQVTPQPGMSPLFLLHRQQRRRIEWLDGDRYALRGLDGSAAPISRLRETIEENPAVVSPGALARAALQDALLGTTLQVMGPSELSYLAQASAVYEVLEVEAPWTSLRPQAMVIEERQVRYLDELGVTLDELVSSAGDLDALLTAKLGEDFVGPVKQQIDEVIGGLRGPIMELDPTLEKPWRRTREQIGRAFDQLASKAAAAVSRRHDVWRRRLEQVSHACVPDGAFQERVLAVIYFVHRFGPGFADDLCSRLRLDPRRLQAFAMSPAPRAVPRSAPSRSEEKA
ncbi:MAG: bacillithiol biosynthesis cysteine-adding enzyme BshC [Thermoanaerobaculia bacterium]